MSMGSADDDSFDIFILCILPNNPENNFKSLFTYSCIVIVVVVVSSECTMGKQFLSFNYLARYGQRESVTNIHVTAVATFAT